MTKEVEILAGGISEAPSWGNVVDEDGDVKLQDAIEVVVFC